MSEEDKALPAAESAPGGGNLGGKLGGFFNVAESATALPGQVSRNWRDRINYAGRRSRVAQLKRRTQSDEPRE